MGSVPDTCTASRVVRLIPTKTVGERKFRKTIFTVSQIAIVVFTIDTQPEEDYLSKLTRYWLTNESITKPRSKKLGAWAKSKGQLVGILFFDNLSALVTTKIDADFFFRLFIEF